jgi:opacity protein-like surface antigen
MWRSVVCACLVFSCVAAAAVAQTPLPPDPADTDGHLQSGPLRLNPRFELLNAGVDWNVFNEAENPKRDFTATLRPSLDAVIRLNVVRFVFQGSLDAVYFHEYEDERALNRSGSIRAELRLNRMVPYAAASGLTARDRPNNEIDLRAERDSNTYGAGAAFLLFSRTAAVVNIQRQRLAYDPGQQFAGEDLATQFNSRRVSYDAGARIALTALTTMSLTGGREEIRFALSPERDSDSTRAGVTLDFDPQAIITGSASVGYRHFDPSDAALQEYRGLVSQVSIRYAYQDRTTLAFRYVRDVDYSVEEAQPYYLLNGGTVTLTQRIGGPIDVQGILGREARHYRARSGFDQPPDRDTDTTDTAAAGVGYRFGDASRLGITYEFTRRDALGTGRSYDRRRLYSALSYGF